LITNDPTLHQQFAFQQNAEGAGLSPFESWLLLRGLKTLALRVERQSDSAQKIARFLKSRTEITQVFYPGLGAVISFTTGDEKLSAEIVETTRLFKIAVSFGSVGSTISLPCRMSHASIPSALRDRLAPPSDLVRLSVGIEDVDDLIADLDRAFALNSRERELAETCR
jgi:cystathionine beta-lyase